MPLQHEQDVSKADWFTKSGASWRQLCSFGPSGFAQYARLFHPARPGDDETDPQSLVDVAGDLDPEVLQRLVSVLARHTLTPQDCYFALWEGFGSIYGVHPVGLRHRESAVTPAFPPHVLEGPRVSIPGRKYLLFRGPLSQAGQWGAADLTYGHPRTINSPNLFWPADHAWFVATEIDVPWTGIGGSAELIRDLMSEGSFDIERVDPAQEQH